MLIRMVVGIIVMCALYFRHCVTSPSVFKKETRDCATMHRDAWETRLAVGILKASILLHLEGLDSFVICH